MAEPEVRFCSAADGVKIAYCDCGEGTPVLSAAYFNNIEVETRWEWHKILASRRRNIWFDARGAGSSQRQVPGFSLDEMTLDIGAVADELGLEKFALFAWMWSTPAAIAYAAKHPERVSHLVLFAGFARAADMLRIPRVKALFATLGEGDYDLFADTFCINVFGWQLPEVGQRVAAAERTSRTPEQAQAYYAAVRQYDVTDILPRISVPTLVMHPRGALFPTLEIARDLAACIPGARLKLLESSMTWSDELEPQYLDTLDEFIGDAIVPSQTHLEPAARRLVRALPSISTVLFTDIVEHTQMMQRLGDALGRSLLREHERITRETLRTYGGDEVKAMGDGFMASFVSVTAAVECAISLQRAFAKFSLPAPLDEETLGVRAGLNAGEPIAEDGDLFGTSVNLAARIAARANAGEILIPEPVRHLLTGKSFVFSDRGEHMMKGFDDAVRLYEVRWRE
jgi:class 3 adenylate cyclase